MRTSLAPHLDEYVLCKGWIGDWEDIKEYSTRRVFVLQPTIKQADKNLLYKEQKTISTEHHLNLFIKFEDLTNYDTESFQLKNTINFTGTVEKYRRSDGTYDYGIYANQQSTLPYRIDRLYKSVLETKESVDDFLNLKRVHKDEQDISYLENFVSREIYLLYRELEQCGDNLPTFKKNYEDLLAYLIGMKEGINNLLEDVKRFEKSRFYKKKNKRKKSNLDRILSIPTPETKTQIRKSLGF